MTDSPTGWPMRPLSELIVSLRNGVFVSRPGINPPGIPILRISAVRPMKLDLDDFRFASIAESKASGYFIDEGDLLFTRYSGSPDLVGACARVPPLSDRRLHPDKLIRVVVNRELVDPGFVELAVTAGHGRRQIEERLKTTAGQVGIAGGQLRTVHIPVPPLHDQRRIVAHIDEQFSRLDDAQSSLRRAERNLDAFLRSSLSALLGKGDGTPGVSIADLLTVNIGGVWGSAAGVDEVDVAVFRVTEFKEHGHLQPSTAATRSITNKQLASRQLVSGDLLLEKSGGGPTTPVGRIARVPSHDGPAVCSNFVQLLRPDETQVDGTYLFWLLTKSYLDGVVVQYQRATTNIRNLQTKDYLQLKVALPPLHEQRAIAADADRMLTLQESLADQIKLAQKRVRSLRQALLTDALSRRTA